MRRREQTDVEFYKSVHQMRELTREWAALTDARCAERRDFCCRQSIAPLVDDADPREGDFHAVDCRDLSTSGFSFLIDELPETDRLCVRLGKPEAYVYVGAEIVHCLPVDTDLGPSYLVGCRFLKKTSPAELATEDATATV